MVMDATGRSCRIQSTFVLGPNDYYSPIPQALDALPDAFRHLHASSRTTLPATMNRQMRDAGWVDLSSASGTLSLPAGLSL